MLKTHPKRRQLKNGPEKGPYYIKKGKMHSPKKAKQKNSTSLILQNKTSLRIDNLQRFLPFIFDPNPNV